MELFHQNMVASLEQQLKDRHPMVEPTPPTIQEHDVYSLAEIMYWIKGWRSAGAGSPFLETHITALGGAIKQCIRDLKVYKIDKQMAAQDRIQDQADIDFPPDGINTSPATAHTGKMPKVAQRGPAKTSYVEPKRRKVNASDSRD
jgi:hypothetical protein